MGSSTSGCLVKCAEAKVARGKYQGGGGGYGRPAMSLKPPARDAQGCRTSAIERQLAIASLGVGRNQLLHDLRRGAISADLLRVCVRVEKDPGQVRLKGYWSLKSMAKPNTYPTMLIRLLQVVIVDVER